MIYALLYIIVGFFMLGFLLNSVKKNPSDGWYIILGWPLFVAGGLGFSFRKLFKSKRLLKIRKGARKEQGMRESLKIIFFIIACLFVCPVLVSAINKWQHVLNVWFGVG